MHIIYMYMYGGYVNAYVCLFFICASLKFGRKCNITSYLFHVVVVALFLISFCQFVSMLPDCYLLPGCVLLQSFLSCLCLSLSLSPVIECECVCMWGGGEGACVCLCVCVHACTHAHVHKHARECRKLMCTYASMLLCVFWIICGYVCHHWADRGEW